MTLPSQTRQSREPQDKFFKVVNEALLIKGHVQLLMWLQGDMQELVPHDVLLVAHGDFAKGKLSYDVIGAVRDIRFEGLDHNDIESLVTGLFQRWQNHGRSVYTLETMSGVILDSACQCQVHRTLRGMRSLMVLGIRDERSGIDALYVLFRDKGSFDENTRRMFEFLLPHIDCAARRVVSHLHNESAKKPMNTLSDLETGMLTKREREIMLWVGCGKTNYEIGIILSISIFTVKNHLCRIFRKINVTNRAQAVSRFNELNLEQV